MMSFIEAHRSEHGIELICNVLPIAPPAYYDRLAKYAGSARRSDLARHDEALRPEIRRSSTKFGVSMARARFGISCTEKASTSPAAR